MSAIPYEIVLCTRNRTVALHMSVPLMINQTHRPSRMIVVDASDDHDAVADTVRKLTRVHGIDVEIIRSPIASLVFQRNLGLKLVTKPIVFFPDDDSLWYQDFASNISRAYELDKEGLVAGVSGTPVQQSPVDRDQETYSQNRKHYIKGLLQPFRNRVERVLVPKPIEMWARENWSRLKRPDWVGDTKHHPGSKFTAIETIVGFRMTFRTDEIRKVGFDETLGYGSGYSQYEDWDVSVSVQKSGRFLIASKDAKVKHFAFPGSRANGESYGYYQIANYLYICCKHFSRDSSSFGKLDRYLKYKLALYKLASAENYGRQVHLGAKYAWKNRTALLDAPVDKLSSTYKAQADRFKIDLGSGKIS